MNKYLLLYVKSGLLVIWKLFPHSKMSVRKMTGLINMLSQCCATKLIYRRPLSEMIDQNHIERGGAFDTSSVQKKVIAMFMWPRVRSHFIVEIKLQSQTSITAYLPHRKHVAAVYT